MKQKFSKVCSILLILTFTITGIPSNVLADENGVRN